jgi:hypothetical protein
VPAVERLTIDVTHARDYLDGERRGGRHVLAGALFELASNGFVELAAASSGYLIDAQGGLEKQLRTMFESKGVASTTQLSYPGVVIPGTNAFPGASVMRLRDAWRAVLADWKTHEGSPPGGADRLHVETHLTAQRDVFITR